MKAPLHGGVLSLPHEQREMMDVIWRGAFIATRTGGDDGCYMEGAVRVAMKALLYITSIISLCSCGNESTPPYNIHHLPLFLWQ
jgi:hypothetical protein